jgi:hypothetical protein
MAGSITVSSITLDSDNTFRILSNTGSSLYTLNSVNQTVTGNLSVDATGTTGIRAPSANTLAFYEGGVEAMRIDSSGNVGIKNTTPQGNLDVGGVGGGQPGDLLVTTGSTTAEVIVGRLSGTGSDNTNFKVRNRVNEVSMLVNAGNKTLQVGKSISVAGATPTSSGSGITFPATQDPSSDANTLDDYEEGTWSPSVGGNATYTSQVGRYTKIGNIVSVYFDITINTIGTGSTSNITNLPFTAISEMSATGSVSYYTGTAVSFTWIGCYAAGGTTNVAFVGNTASAATTAGYNGIALFQNGSRVLVSIVYRVA